MEEENSFGDWLSIGITNGWVSDAFCVTHDGGYQYMDDEELEEWEAGGDPCQHVVRILI